jgi:hypothetical protein
MYTLIQLQGYDGSFAPSPQLEALLNVENGSKFIGQCEYMGDCGRCGVPEASPGCATKFC